VCVYVRNVVKYNLRDISHATGFTRKYDRLSRLLIAAVLSRSGRIHLPYRSVRTHTCPPSRRSRLNVVARRNHPAVWAPRKNAGTVKANAVPIPFVFTIDVTSLRVDTYAVTFSASYRRRRRL